MNPYHCYYCYCYCYCHHHVYLSIYLSAYQQSTNLLITAQLTVSHEMLPLLIHTVYSPVHRSTLPSLSLL